MSKKLVAVASEQWAAVNAAVDEMAEAPQSPVPEPKVVKRAALEKN